MEGEAIILGGNLNFSMGDIEIWGQKLITDPLSGYFIQDASP